MARAPAAALIGPNAILQTVAVMEERLGAAETRKLLAGAQIAVLPSGGYMVAEIHALRLHRWLALHDPFGSRIIAEDAGSRTADYIIAHRIPAPARWLLRHLPARVAAPLLMAAIRRHAWTFVGAGAFAAQGAWHFTIDRAQADDAVPLPDSLWHWYAAVFTRLYRQLVDEDCLCRMEWPDPGHSQRRSYSIGPGGWAQDSRISLRSKS